MRVLAYSDSRVHSGAEVVFAQVCAGLAGEGVRLSLVVPEANLGLRAALREAAPGAEVSAVPGQGLRLAGLQLWRPARLARVRRAVAGDHDALLVNLPSVEYGGAPAIVSRVPAVGLLHVHASPRDAGFRLGAARQLAARPAIRRFRHLHVVAPGADERVAREWGLPRAAVSGLPLSRPRVSLVPRAEARAALGLPPDAPVVLLLGRLSILQKGHDLLLAAAPAIRERAPGTVLLLAGDGPDRARIEQLAAERGLGDVVRLAGARPAGLALGAADAIAIPSRFEGLPLVALEALACGLPGAAASVDGLRSAWPGDWQVPPDDVPALADMLVRALSAGGTARAAFRSSAAEALDRVTAASPHAPVLATLRRAAGAT